MTGTPEDAAENIRRFVTELGDCAKFSSRPASEMQTRYLDDVIDTINRAVTGLYDAGIVEGFRRALEALHEAEATATWVRGLDHPREEG